VTRERRVAPLAVKVVRAEHERAVDGRALSVVGGQRVAMVQVAGLEVRGVEIDRRTP
jgi:hypothetical protein